MLTIKDVLEMMARGEKLPQQKLQSPTDAQIERIQKAEPEILNEILEAPEDADPAMILADRINALADELGWYQVVSVLCMTFAHRYTPDTVPAMDLETAPSGTIGLLRMFALSARATAEEGAWTIPIAMLADLGRKEAQLVTVCAGFCAVVGHLGTIPSAGAQS